ncbi:MAG: hypothetical protein FWF11_02460, partial [Coriobacteriia bacterium]|nr:hypothetical protein [Coriobacteriia bacterium]
MTAKMPKFRTRAGEPSGKPRLALLIAVIFLLALPFLAAANSSALQSVFDPVIMQVQNMVSPADDAFVANETPALTTSGISSLSSSGFRPEPTTFSAGLFHSLAVKPDGTLWAWGRNFEGQTGLESQYALQTVPAQVGTATNWKAVSAEGWYSLGIRTDGTLWAWGSNEHGQTGITGLPTGYGSNQLTPAQVGTATDWAQVSAGGGHSLAIRSDGTLWSWGNNSNGVTGLGTTAGNTPVPTQVGTDANWTAVSAGDWHSLALRADGTLWSWGANGNGATGLGTVSGDQTTPAQVGTATNWAAVSAGGAHSMAIRSDGTLWAWGWNFGGQVGIEGLGTGWGAIHQTTPAQIGTATNWVQVSAGGNHSHAIRSDGTLWAWGGSDEGETGLGIDIGGPYQLTPAQVGTDTNWVSVGTASGGGHVFATRTNSSLWGWGRNFDGELGINDTMYRLVPTFIWGPPTIENITPQGRDVAITTTELVITFDQRMHIANPGTVALNGVELSLAGATWTDNDTVLTIPFADPLDYATGYEVILLGFIVEMGRFTMTEPYVHHFVTEIVDLDLAITKNLLMPEGTAVPDTNFIFNIDAYSLNGETSTVELAYMPNLSVNPVAFSSADTGTVDGDTTTITRWSDFLLGSDLSFPFAGIYVYRISEADNTFVNTDTETMIFDPTVYQITFQVENLPAPASGLFVRAIFLQLVVDGVPGPKIDITDNLADALTFTNIFVRNHDNDDPLDPNVLGGLRIAKAVEGAMANQARFFDFDIGIWVPSILTTPTSYRAYVVENIAGVPTVVTTADNGTIAGTSGSGDYLLFSNGATQTVSLRHGQTLVFAGTHVGARYSVTEQAAANYTPSVAVLTGGLPVVVAPADTPNTALTVPVQILGEAANIAAFTNTHSAVIEAGLDVGNFGSALLLMAVVG